MQSFRKLLLVAGCLVVALGAEAQDQGGKKKPREKEKPEAPAKDGKGKAKNKSEKGKKESAEEAEKESRRMPFPLPIGHGGKGLTIPYLDGTARKTMNFSVGTAQRVDADNVEMGELTIETYDEEAKPEMTIDLPVSKINLTTRVISTEKHVHITRDDFELTGNAMEFDTISKQGTIKGNVRMLIYNIANEINSDEPAKPKEEPKPGA